MVAKSLVDVGKKIIDFLNGAFSLYPQTVQQKIKRILTAK